MRQLKTTDDILADRALFTEDEAQQIKENAIEEAYKILHGGKRKGAGRKPKYNCALNITIKVSADELEFLNYARENRLNLKDFMQGC